MPVTMPATQELGTLWTLRKDGHDARADVRGIDGIGFELRYVWDGDLRVSEVFRDWTALDQAAAAKRRELEARGWTAAANNEGGHDG